MSRGKKFVSGAMLIGVLLWLGLSPCVATDLYNEFLLERAYPGTYSIADDSEPVVFQSRGQMLQGRLHTVAESDKVVIFYGGRGSNRERNHHRARALVDTGVSALTFEYRGFGSTPGKPSTGSMFEDGEAAFDAAVALGFRPEEIVLYGESLGAAVAAYVGSTRPAAGLILQSGFSSLPAQLKDMIPPLKVYPKIMFPKPDMSTDKTLKRGHPPLLILHGDRDSTIDVKHAYRLAEAAAGDTTLVVFAGAGHIDLFYRSDWKEAVIEFLSRLNVP